MINYNYVITIIVQSLVTRKNKVSIIYDTTGSIVYRSGNVMLTLATDGSIFFILR